MYAAELQNKFATLVDQRVLLLFLKMQSSLCFLLLYLYLDLIALANA